MRRGPQTKGLDEERTTDKGTGRGEDHRQRDWTRRGPQTKGLDEEKTTDLFSFLQLFILGVQK